ncbi:hypothetical protein E8F11_15470 [Pseudomonas sp. BN417]|nr:hypothetical protein [Pseudomonas sp. BN417]
MATRITSWRSGAPDYCRRFFVPAMLCHGGCARETERSAGSQLARFANLRTAVTSNRLATIFDSSISQVGAALMNIGSPYSQTAVGKPRTWPTAIALDQRIVGGGP